MKSQLEKLQNRLVAIEKQLDTCRTSSFIDGWQTSTHAKKSRKWDILAQRKMEILKQIDVLQNE